jgi:hypothetical protein
MQVIGGMAPCREERTAAINSYRLSSIKAGEFTRFLDR